MGILICVGILMAVTALLRLVEIRMASRELSEDDMRLAAMQNAIAGLEKRHAQLKAILLLFPVMTSRPVVLFDCSAGFVHIPSFLFLCPNIRAPPVM